LSNYFDLLLFISGYIAVDSDIVCSTVRWHVCEVVSKLVRTTVSAVIPNFQNEKNLISFWNHTAKLLAKLGPNNAGTE